MNIKQFDPKADERSLRACYDIVVSGQGEDDPGVPPFSYPMFSGWWRHGLSGEPKEIWLATGDDGEPVGCYHLELPSRENRENAFLWPIVALGARRHGTGTALLAHAAERARQNGRTMIMSDTRVGSPGEAFALAIGAKPGLQDARRILDIGPELQARLPGLRADAEPHATGYTLRYWIGPAPEDLIAGIAAVEDAMADAPHNAAVEPMSWDIERVRAADKRLIEQGLRQYSIAAIHDATGQLAARTECGVDPELDFWALQGMTAVTRQHRGHRLGMLLKVANLERLIAAEPQVRQVMTFNAVANDHMIAVNDSLGHRATDLFQGFEFEVAALLEKLSMLNAV